MENFYDARKVGKRTNPISPNPEKSYFYDWNFVKKITKSTKLPVIPKEFLLMRTPYKLLKVDAKVFGFQTMVVECLIQE